MFSGKCQSEKMMTRDPRPQTGVAPRRRRRGGRQSVRENSSSSKSVFAALLCGRAAPFGQAVKAFIFNSARRRALKGKL